MFLFYMCHYNFFFPKRGFIEFVSNLNPLFKTVSTKSIKLDYIKTFEDA
jgi:hypothetical protein